MLTIQHNRDSATLQDTPRGVMVQLRRWRGPVHVHLGTWFLDLPFHVALDEVHAILHREDVE